MKALVRALRLLSRRFAFLHFRGLRFVRSVSAGCARQAHIPLPHSRCHHARHLSAGRFYAQRIVHDRQHSRRADETLPQAALRGAYSPSEA